MRTFVHVKSVLCAVARRYGINTDVPGWWNKSTERKEKQLRTNNVVKSRESALLAVVAARMQCYLSRVFPILLVLVTVIHMMF